MLVGLTVSDVDGAPVAYGNGARAFRHVGHRRAWEELQSSALLGSSAHSYEQSTHKLHLLVQSMYSP